MWGQANVDDVHLWVRQSLINITQCAEIVAFLPNALNPLQVLIHNSPDREPVFQSAKGGQMFTPNARA
jgi:hypothetical protein